MLSSVGFATADTADTAKIPAELLSEILSREEFQPRTTEQPFMEELRAYIFRKWGEWRRSLREFLGALPRPEFTFPEHFKTFFEIVLDGMRLLLLAVAILLVSLLSLFLFRFMRRGARRLGEHETGEEEDAALSPAELLASLDPNLAGLLRLHAFVRREIRREGGLAAGVTDRECISKDVKSEWSGLFSDLSRLHESAVYQERSVSHAEINRIIALARGMR